MTAYKATPCYTLGGGFSVATKSKQRGEHMGGFAQLTEQKLSAMMRVEWCVAAHSLSKAC